MLLIFYIEFDEFETNNHYDRMRIPLPEPSSKDYGAYLRQMRAAAALRAGGDRVPSRQSQRGDYYGIYNYHLTILTNCFMLTMLYKEGDQVFIKLDQMYVILNCKLAICVIMHLILYRFFLAHSKMIPQVLWENGCSKLHQQASRTDCNNYTLFLT